jgi:hypothetical protein
MEMTLQLMAENTFSFVLEYPTNLVNPNLSGCLFQKACFGDSRRTMDMS